MPEALYIIAAIAVVALVTWGLRAAPFALFGSRPLPRTMRYLGRALPPAIMTVLVIYCLRGTSFGRYPFGIPELAACALVVLLQIVKKNMYLSIIAGTVCYMALIRVL
ncbi:MAG: AzlD domain-containing protein [Clostridia bacterium]|nr:AzlD domain-containing protein [Clostridia bacterium]